MVPLRLKLLEPHRGALEKCVYCPKLSRAACPVSNVEANETVTPWGKMSMAYFAARGDVPIEPEYAAPAWACTACYACRERCDHKNEVATVLGDTRAEMFSAGVAPAEARAVAAGWQAFGESVARAHDALEDLETPTAETAVVVGCGYARTAPEVARDALRAVAALTGGPVRTVKVCCGLPLLHAGDRVGFGDAARRLGEGVGAAKRVVAVDPGCARALRVEYARVGARRIDAELFVDLARDRVGSLRELADVGAAGPVRWHDPCQLGRGLDRFDEPRAVLARILGAPPAEFLHTRAHADCSGAGGLLPLTRPESSRAIADERIAEHAGLGGGLVVTACAQSLRRFRSRGQRTEDLVSLVARSLLG